METRQQQHTTLEELAAHMARKRESASVAAKAAADPATREEAATWDEPEDDLSDLIAIFYNH